MHADWRCLSCSTLVARLLEPRILADVRGSISTVKDPPTNHEDWWGDRRSLDVSCHRSSGGAGASVGMTREGTTAHGTILLSREPDMTGALVEWFRRTLG